MQLSRHGLSKRLLIGWTLASSSWMQSALAHEVNGSGDLASDSSASKSEHRHPTNEEFTIEGVVTDQRTGSAMPFVRVRVRGTNLADYTEKNGYFCISGITHLPAILVVDDPSVEPVTVRVVTSDGLVDISARYQMDENDAVVVHGVLPATPSASQATVSDRDIAAVPMRNAEDAMRLVPGLTLVQHGSEGKGHQFFLRGFDAVHGTDLEVTLEGIPVNEWSNVHGQGYVDLGFIIPETITRLTAIKGPFVDSQGAFGMAGSVDYQLGIPMAQRGLRATLSLGTTNRTRGVMTYSPRAGDGGDFIALEGLHDQAYGQNRAITRAGALARVRLFDSPSKGTLSVLSSTYLAQFELPGAMRNDDVEAGHRGFYDSYDHAGRGLSGRGLLAISYEKSAGRQRISSKIYGGYRRLELLENYTGFLIDTVNGDRRLQKQSTINFGALMEDTIDLGQRFVLHLGASMRADAIDQSQQHLDQQERSIDTERSLYALQAMSSAYSSLRFRPINALSITAGGRIDAAQVRATDRAQRSASNSGALFAVSPRLTSDLRILDPWHVYVSYGRGVRPPEARAFSSYTPKRTGISDDLYHGGQATMTHSDAIELGTRIRASKYLGIVTTGFATFIANEAVFDHVSGLNLELSRTRRLGAEIVLHSEPTSWLSLEADATIVDARFVESKNAIPFAPWLSGGARLIVTHPSGFQAGLRFFGLAPRPLPHGAKGAAMALLDATLGYHWQHFRLDLAVENLLNQRLREGEYHYASDWDPSDGTSQIPVLQTSAGPPLNARLAWTVVY